nr:unnamed protein product [Spirometra erinaceieuropaei]
MQSPQELLKIRKMKDIVTLPADKGLSTVVMDKAEYCTKLGNLLMDKEAYAPSTVSEFKKVVNSINNTIGKLRKAGALTRREALAAKASDTAMTRFYGLPKVHKQGVPLHPIVSLRGTPTFGLSKWLYQRLCFLTKNSEWTVKPAEEFLTRIKHLEVEADEVMVSFDVISLFTSIPPALAIDTIDGFLREKYDETDQQLKRAHIIELLELCLKTFFTFNGQVYEQKKGTPMGSPLSGLIAEAVLQRLEQQVFSSYPPKVWVRYVDDTLVVIKRSEVKAFKTLLNSIFPDIQFSMEEEVNNQLPFLDVQVTRLTDGKIRTTVYLSVFIAGVILTFLSCALCRQEFNVSTRQNAPFLALNSFSRRPHSVKVGNKSVPEGSLSDPCVIGSSCWQMLNDTQYSSLLANPSYGPASIILYPLDSQKSPSAIIVKAKNANAPANMLPQDVGEILTPVLADANLTLVTILYGEDVKLMKTKKG